MSISNAYDMGLLSRTFQVNNIFKVYLYICTHNKPSRFIFSNSNIRHVIASLVFQSRTATIQIQKNRGAIEIRFVSVSSHIPDVTNQFIQSIIINQLAGKPGQHGLYPYHELGPRGLVGDLCTLQ